MLCGFPLKLSTGREVPCGQCMSCRINKKREWVGRMLAELDGGRGSFVTLTYNPEHLPDGGTLVPADLVAWRKYLRKLVGSFRYFAVGEYGDLSERPHYHAILFDLPPAFEGRITQAWAGRGFVSVGHAEKASISYCAHYVTKKMTSPADQRLNGRYPEFTSMSQRPPLGWTLVPRIVRALMTEQGAHVLAEKGPPRAFKQNGQEWPLGRYLYSKLCTELDRYAIFPKSRQDDFQPWTVDIDYYQVIQDAERNQWGQARIASELRRLEVVQSEAEKERQRQRAQRRAEKLWRKARKRLAAKV